MVACGLLLSAAPPTIQVTRIRSGETDLFHVTTGPDGAVWASGRDRIVRIDASGGITNFPLALGPGEYERMAGPIVTGTDGALWFAEFRQGQQPRHTIVRMTTQGSFTEYAIPASIMQRVDLLGAGQDGAIWFSGDNDRLGRLAFDGTVSSVAVPAKPFASSSRPGAPIADSAGTVWFTANDTELWRILLGGSPVKFVDARVVHGTKAASADGSIWSVAEGDGLTEGGVVRVAPNGGITKFGVTGVASAAGASQLWLNWIALGPDGALWFTSDAVDAIGRVTTSGELTMYPLNGTYHSSGMTRAIAAGQNGTLWITEGRDILRVELGLAEQIKPVSAVKALPATSSPAFQVEWSGSDVGSGIRDYSIYVSEDGGAFRQWISRTSATSATYAGMAGHRYGFYSLARDRADNEEAAKSAAEASTEVAAAPVKPVSSVMALPAKTTTPEFQVRWTGTGNGPLRYSIRVSMNGGSYETWIASTTATQALFPYRGPYTYRFISQAVDRDGNQESWKTAAEAMTSVELAPQVLAAVAGKSGPQDARQWTFRVTNTGKFRVNVGLSILNMAQTGGVACRPVLPANGVSLGFIAPGQSGTGSMVIHFGGCPANARFTVQLKVLMDGGMSSATFDLKNQFQ
jgi:hypothetical protein